MNLTVRDVCRILDLPEDQVLRMAQRKALPAYRVQNQYRFNTSEIMEWASANAVELKEPMFDASAASLVESGGISHALAAGGVHHKIPGVNKTDVLTALIYRVPLPETMDREALCRILLAREKMASTGIGHGIAIPHVRNPVILNVQEPCISLGFLEHPVDFSAIDGEPVHAMFLIITPSTRIHLSLLAKLMLVLRQEGFKSAVSRHASATEILTELRTAELNLRDASSRGDA